MIVVSCSDWNEGLLALAGSTSDPRVINSLRDPWLANGLAMQNYAHSQALKKIPGIVQAKVQANRAF